MKEAFKKTCEYRETIFSKETANEVLSKLEKDEQIKKRWFNYVKKNDFASGIEFDDVMKTCEVITDILFE